MIMLWMLDRRGISPPGADGAGLVGESPPRAAAHPTSRSRRYVNQGVHDVPIISQNISCRLQRTLRIWTLVAPNGMSRQRQRGPEATSGPTGKAPASVDD